MDFFSDVDEHYGVEEEGFVVDGNVVTPTVQVGIE